MGMVRIGWSEYFHLSRTEEEQMVNVSGADSEHDAGALREAEEKMLLKRGERPESSDAEEDDDAGEERGTEDR